MLLILRGLWVSNFLLMLGLVDRIAEPKENQAAGEIFFQGNESIRALDFILKSQMKSGASIIGLGFGREGGKPDMRNAFHKFFLDLVGQEYLGRLIDRYAFALLLLFLLLSTLESWKHQ